MTLTAVSLFAGVGGIDLALERAGMEVKAAVEIDKAARGVLADRFPNTTLFPDVTKVTADDLRRAGFLPERGLVCAGWPCQGNSVAGRRQGLADPRSGLWSHVVRLLDELRPRWFLGENVPGLLSVTDGEDFGRVLQDLADLGMGFAYRVLDAQHFGVPQRRRRVFIVGHLGDARRPVEVLLEPEGSEGHPPAGTTARENAAATAAVGVAVAGEQGGIANTLCARDAKGPMPDQSLGTVVIASALTGNGVGTCGADDNQAQAGHIIPTTFQNVVRSGARDEDGNLPPEVRRLTPLECERLQGYPDNWTATSNGRPQADSPRYKQMGNSVAVPCVEWIANRIVRADRKSA